MDSIEGYHLTHMDEFIDELLRNERVCDVMLPRLIARHVLEDNDDLDPRESFLDQDLESDEEDNRKKSDQDEED